MASGKLIAGVEVSGTVLRIALLTLKPVPTIVHCEEIPLQPGDEPRIGAFVARAVARFGARRADVHLVFSPPQPAPGRHHIFTAPKLSRGELLQVSMRELKRDGTLDPNNAYFSVDSLEMLDGDAKGQRFLIVALAKEPVDVAAMSVLEAKLTVRSASTSAIGLMRAAQVTDIPATGIVALAQLDIRRSTLIVLENGVPLFFRDIPTSFAKGGREGADDALIAQALARELDISLVFFAQQYRPKQVDTIMIVGDAEVADRVSEWLEDSQTYRVVRFGPGAKLRVQANVPPNLLPYAAAVGAALGSRKGPAADLLPSELRGRPERVIATSIAAVMTVVVALIVLQLNGAAAREADAQEQRYLSLNGQVADLKRRVSQAAQLDSDGARADVWKSYLERVDLYHKKIANLLYALQGALPTRGRLSEAILGDAPDVLKMSPVQIKTKGNIRLQLAGIMRDPNLQAAQSDVLSVFHTTETLTPSVVRSSLTPLTQVGATNGSVDLPFQIEVSVLNEFPGPKR